MAKIKYNPKSTRLRPNRLHIVSLIVTHVRWEGYGKKAKQIFTTRVWSYNNKQWREIA